MKIKSFTIAASLVLLAGACSNQEPSATGTASMAGDAGTAGLASAGSAAGASANASAIPRIDASGPASAAAVALPGGGSIAGRRSLSRVAGLPDHGELVTYPGRVTRVEGAYTWYRAGISEAHALAAMASGHLRVTTPDGRLLNIVYDRHVEHPENGDWTWIGHLAGHKGVETLLTIGTDAVFGSIGQDVGLPLRLTMHDGLSWLVETDPAQIAALDNAATRPSRPDFLVPVQPRQGPRAASAGAVPVAGSAGAEAADNTVDVLVGYTSGFREARLSTSAALTRINEMVDTTNSAYVNSGINGQVRLVHAMEVDYRDDTSNGEALEQLSGYESGTGFVTPDPAFDDLRAARETYGADLVVLVRAFRDPENAGCGIAWLLGGSLQGMAPGEGWDQLGYSVVSDGRDVNEEDGKRYYCLESTFAHELGHNMGAAHDKETAKGEDGNLDNPDDYGAYTFSFGNKTTVGDGNFYTVMAYGDSGQIGYNAFSSPSNDYCGGHACGVAGTDNTLTLNNTLPVVAGFRDEVVAPEEPEVASWLVVDPAHNDLNGDGRSDLVWHSGQFQRMQPWLMNGTSWTYGSARYVSSKYEVAGVGDFDGNGRADILWRDIDRTQLWMWAAMTDGSYTVSLLRYYPGGWEIAGISDGNGDGRSDIHWFNPEQRKLQSWFMDGVHWSYGKVHPTAANASILAIADVSGDGRADVVWHDESVNTVAVWLRGATDNYSAKTLRSYPDGWKVVAVADANGDGRMDLFWHNREGERIQSWLMNGFLWAYGPVNPIASQYEVASVGDFNGDGRADLIWQDESLARVWSWQARSDLGYAVALLRYYPTGWALVH